MKRFITPVVVAALFVANVALSTRDAQAQHLLPVSAPTPTYVGNWHQRAAAGDPCKGIFETRFHITQQVGQTLAGTYDVACVDLHGTFGDGVANATLDAQGRLVITIRRPGSSGATFGPAELRGNFLTGAFTGRNGVLQDHGLYMVNEGG